MTLAKEESPGGLAPPGRPFWRRPLTPEQSITGLVMAVAVIGLGAFGTVRYLNEQTGRAGPGGSGPVVSAPSPAAGAFPVGEDAFSLIPVEEIFPGGPPKDGIPALTDPAMVTEEEAARRLRSGDRLIGVAINGEAAAYPLRILNWHEIVNDTIGGVPVAVTYCPLCDSALVFDRRIGGEVREFGVSGLLYNSNVLMYDRQGREAEESLWSQMMLKAVVGPAAEAGLELKLVPAQLVTWEAWREAHPGTEVLSFETGHWREYDANPYESYFESGRLMFPVSYGEGSDAGALEEKEPVIVVESGGMLKGYPVSRLAAALDGEEVRDEFGGRTFVFRPVDAEGGTWFVTDEGGRAVPTAFSFWFKFRAAHPEAEVYRQGE